MSRTTPLLPSHVGSGHRLFGRAARRGAMLLEVVISLGILLVAMAVVGLAFHNGQQHVELAERMTRARLMTEKLIAEMDTGLLDLTDREQSGWFGEESIPGLSWRVEVNPSDRVKGLLEVDLSIYMGDPDGSDDEHQLILAMRVERAEPRGIDLKKDFGLDEDQITQFDNLVPGGLQNLSGGGNGIDFRKLLGADLDTLVELLPTLIQAFGANLGQGQIDQLIQAAQSGDLSGVQNVTGPQGLGVIPGGSNRGSGGGGPGGGRPGGGRPGGGR